MPQLRSSAEDAHVNEDEASNQIICKDALFTAWPGATVAWGRKDDK